MECFGLGVGVVAAIAATWSAYSAHQSAKEAKSTRRPYLAVTGNQVTSWDGHSGTARFFITNAGPVPGRITSQSNVTTSSGGPITHHGTGPTQSNIVYPVEVEPIGFDLPMSVGDRVEIALEYEDLGGQQAFRFDIIYLVDASGQLQIVRRDAI